MAEFGVAATLEVDVDDSSLRRARDRIEDELGDVSVTVDASTPSQRAATDGGGSALGTAGGAAAVSELSEQTGLLEEIRDILDEQPTSSGGGTSIVPLGLGSGGAGLLGGGAGAGAGGAGGMGAAALLGSAGAGVLLGGAVTSHIINPLDDAVLSPLAESMQDIGGKAGVQRANTAMALNPAAPFTILGAGVAEGTRGPGLFDTERFGEGVEQSTRTLYGEAGLSGLVGRYQEDAHEGPDWAQDLSVPEPGWASTGVLQVPAPEWTSELDVPQPSWTADLSVPQPGWANQLLGNRNNGQGSGSQQETVVSEPGPPSSGVRDRTRTIQNLRRFGGPELKETDPSTRLRREALDDGSADSGGRTPSADVTVNQSTTVDISGLREIDRKIKDESQSAAQDVTDELERRLTRALGVNF